MVNRILVPKNVHAQIPRTCDYVTLHDKRDFKDIIKFTVSEIKRLFWIIQMVLI